MGPLLFFIYINDITDNLTGMARLSADDTSLSFSPTNLAVIEEVVNNDYNLEIKYDTNVLEIVDSQTLRSNFVVKK